MRALAIFILVMSLSVAAFADLKNEDLKGREIESFGDEQKNLLQGLSPEMEKQLKEAIGDLQKHQEESKKLLNELEKEF